MQIELSKKQFKSLLKVVYLGNWMANAHRDGSAKDPHVEEYEEIEDYIFSYAKQFGFDEYLDDEDADEGKFFPTRLFEEETGVNELHDEYNEETFWVELIDRLGERDFVRHHGIEAIRKMDSDEAYEKRWNFIEKWDKEVCENGLDNIGIICNEKAEKLIK